MNKINLSFSLAKRNNRVVGIRFQPSVGQEAKDFCRTILDLLTCHRAKLGYDGHTLDINHPRLGPASCQIETEYGNKLMSALLTPSVRCIYIGTAENPECLIIKDGNDETVEFEPLRAA